MNPKIKVQLQHLQPGDSVIWLGAQGQPSTSHTKLRTLLSSRPKNLPPNFGISIRPVLWMQFDDEIRESSYYGDHEVLLIATKEPDPLEVESTIAWLKDHLVEP